MYNFAIDKIKNFTKQIITFFCKDIKEALQEKDALKKQLEENEVKCQQDKEKYISEAKEKQMASEAILRREAEEAK